MKYTLMIETNEGKQLIPYGNDELQAHSQFNWLIASLIHEGYKMVVPAVNWEYCEMQHPEREGSVTIELLPPERSTAEVLRDMFGELNDLLDYPIAQPFQRRMVS